MEEPAFNPNKITTKLMISFFTLNLPKRINQPVPPITEHRNKPNLMEFPNDRPNSIPNAGRMEAPGGLRIHLV